MWRSVLRFLVVSTALALGGCIDMETVVHVKPDGSGVVEERVLMKKELAAMLASMSQSMGAPSGAAPTSPLLDRNKLAEEATAMGPGVTLLGAEALETEKGTGYVARFAFADIAKLRLNANPGDRVPSRDAPDGGQNAGPPAGGKKEPIRFSFTPGDEPVLVVHAPEDDDRGPVQDGSAQTQSGQSAPDRAESAQDAAQSQMATMMMKPMLDGLRVAIYVQTETEIRETNAAYRDGSRVTVMEMDFSKLLEDPERFKAFADSAPQGVAEAKALMKDVPGMKVDPSPEIRIRMAGR